MRVLIAEDDLVSRSLLARMVRSLGHTVVEVADGAEGWREVADFRPDVLITDWSMPGMDGLELVCRIRARRNQPYCWVIMLTARDFSENYATATTAGVDDYLVKPLDRTILMGRLDVAARVLAMTGRIAQLESCLPICMHCHSVKDLANQWQHLERYVQDHAKVSFSHGFCPDCYFGEIMEPELRALRSVDDEHLLSKGEPVDARTLSRLDALAKREAPEIFEEVSDYLRYATDRTCTLVTELHTVGRLDYEKRGWLSRFVSRAEVLGARRLKEVLERVLESGRSVPPAHVQAALDATRAVFEARADEARGHARR